MKVKITSFKDAGKWYDAFELYIPEDTKCFQTEDVLEEIYKLSPNLKEFYFVAHIDETTPGKWFLRMFKPELIQMEENKRMVDDWFKDKQIEENKKNASLKQDNDDIPF